MITKKKKLEIFSLTSSVHKTVDIKSPRVYKSSNSTSLIQNRSFIDEIKKLEQIISDFTAENQELAKYIEHLEGAAHKMEERVKIVSVFENDLNTNTNELDIRRKELDALENKNKIFRPPTEKKPQEPHSPRVGHMYKGNLDFRYTKPSPRPFPPPSLLPHKRTDAVQADLISEANRMTQMALYNERRMVILKMKLRLCHDHRDLSSLRDELDNLQADQGGNKDNDAIKNIQDSSDTIKERIEYEKFRIEQLEAEDYDIHRAATLMQSLWRGYKIRKTQSDQ